VSYLGGGTGFRAILMVFVERQVREEIEDEE
jgi:hypothetical protein